MEEVTKAAIEVAALFGNLWREILCALAMEMFCNLVAYEHLCTDVFGLDLGLRWK